MDDLAMIYMFSVIGNGWLTELIAASKGIIRDNKAAAPEKFQRHRPHLRAIEFRQGIWKGSSCKGNTIGIAISNCVSDFGVVDVVAGGGFVLPLN